MQQLPPPPFFLLNTHFFVRSFASVHRDETSKGTIELGKGDALLGDTLRSTVAELLVTSLLAPIAAPDFAVVNTDGARPSEEQLAAMYESLLE